MLSPQWSPPGAGWGRGRRGLGVPGAPGKVARGKLRHGVGLGAGEDGGGVGFFGAGVGLWGQGSILAFWGGVLGFGHFGDQGGILGCSPPPCAIAVPAALEGMRQHPEVLGGGGCHTQPVTPPTSTCRPQG